MKNTVKPLLMILSILVFSTISANSATTLRHKWGGSNIWNTTGSFTACQPSANGELQAQHFQPGMLQGMIRFKWTFYKNGQPIKTDQQIYDLRGAGALAYQNYTFQSTFFNMPTTAGSYVVNLEVKRGKWKPFFWEYSDGILDESSSPFVIKDVVPTNSFKIRNTAGIFEDAATAVAPIQVSLNGGIIMDASPTQCTVGYLVIVQESDNAWNRPGQYELDKKWVAGQPPTNLNLQQFVTTYSQSDGTGYFSLLGNTFTTGPYAGKQRYYRIGLQAAAAPWNPRMTLIQVNW